ncbi:hypothetical protein C8F04DRAFT_1250123 [Mycena alexandri]|uniref:FHA domain-containing protein n=1 Tax=Mycena alexandri TaxID=1745969 RepID=A0AAD6TGE5_9AGAR|nr:hypothetical protein C8F04DRAFT_1250123 [Mycena alexandri]
MASKYPPRGRISTKTQGVAVLGVEFVYEDKPSSSTIIEPKQGSDTVDVGRKLFGFNKKTVSWNHARLTFKTSKVSITDLGSSWGTWVQSKNGPLTVGSPHFLKDGDRIVFGARKDEGISKDPNTVRIKIIFLPSITSPDTAQPNLDRPDMSLPPSRDARDARRRYISPHPTVGIASPPTPSDHRPGSHGTSQSLLPSMRESPTSDSREESQAVADSETTSTPSSSVLRLPSTMTTPSRSSWIEGSQSAPPSIFKAVKKITASRPAAPHMAQTVPRMSQPRPKGRVTPKTPSPRPTPDRVSRLPSQSATPPARKVNGAKTPSSPSPRNGTSEKGNGLRSTGPKKKVYRQSETTLPHPTLLPTAPSHFETDDHSASETPKILIVSSDTSPAVRDSPLSLDSKMANYKTNGIASLPPYSPDAGTTFLTPLHIPAHSQSDNRDDPPAIQPSVLPPHHRRTPSVETLKKYHALSDSDDSRSLPKPGVSKSGKVKTGTQKQVVSVTGIEFIYEDSNKRPEKLTVRKPDGSDTFDVGRNLFGHNMKIISSTHARLTFKISKVSITDLGSSEGTWVQSKNGALTVGSPHMLQDGDRIVFGARADEGITKDPQAIRVKVTFLYEPAAHDPSVPAQQDAPLRLMNDVNQQSNSRPGTPSGNTGVAENNRSSSPALKRSKGDERRKPQADLAEKMFPDAPSQIANAQSERPASAIPQVIPHTTAPRRRASSFREDEHPKVPETSYTELSGHVEIPWSEGFRPGYGVSALTGEFTAGSAFHDVNHINVVETSRPAKSHTTIEHLNWQTVKEFQDDFEISVGATVNVPCPLVGANAKIAKILSENTSTSKIVVQYKVEVTFSPEFISADLKLEKGLDKLRDEDFRAQYGDYYIAGYQRGYSCRMIAVCQTNEKKVTESLGQEVVLLVIFMQFVLMQTIGRSVR